MFLSWYVLQGLMALLGLEFNLINIVISTFIFGIGVDYSIFAASRAGTTWKWSRTSSAPGTLPPRSNG